MRYLIVGGVAAGTKAAAKLKRCDRSAEVLVVTKGEDISYAGCGLPYYIGGDIKTREELIVNTPAAYEGLTGVTVRTGCEAVALDAAAHEVTVREKDGSEHAEAYDKLIVATGATPFVPPVPGTDLDGVFCVRTPDDAEGIRSYIERNGCRRAVVVGAGFIGLEVAENLLGCGLSVTVIDAAPQVMPNAFDPEMAGFVTRKLREAGVRVLTGTALAGIAAGEGDAAGRAAAVETPAGALPADVVVLAIGIRPATAWLDGSGVETLKGCVLVDEYSATNVPDVCAVGDCAEVRNAITGQPQWSAMGSTANIAARALARTLTGTPTPYPGVLGTGVVRLLPTLNAGRTGLTEAQAREAGYDVETAVVVTDDKAHYYPGASDLVTKLVADRATHRLLGAQFVSAGAVDKFCDIAVVAIYRELRVEDLDLMDFSYAPPFSTAINPVVTAGYVLENKLSGQLETFTPAQYAAGEAADYAVVDLMPAATVPGAGWEDLATLDGELPGHAKDEKLLLVCGRGKRAYFAQVRLKAAGYTNTRVLEGGLTFNEVRVPRRGAKLPAAEIKRLKGMGCLQDKRYDDVFNVRVITRNGKLTAAEQKCVAEASEKFGSGEVTMTTRLTLEVQGVRYEQIEPCIQFLRDHGLDAGGTGSKVRPVVSCKGTTCQYGLIDTFDLSEKLHERFYVGYHGVELPHKFKIAVGGCPNSCMKPSLNDFGIEAHRPPIYDLEKCRGCKKCLVAERCPMRAVKVVDGKARVDKALCNDCGVCVEKCPFGVTPAVDEPVFAIFVGGTWGKHTRMGTRLSRYYKRGELDALVEKTILWFRENAFVKERLGAAIDRVGVDAFEAAIATDDLLSRKDAILAAPLKERQA